MKLYSFLLTTLLSLSFQLSIAQQENLDLRFDKPARQWEETLPLGNGRLGITPDGGVQDELIVLNDITLWSGAPQDANNYEAYKYLPEIRRLINEGKNEEAQELVNKAFICLGKGSGSVPFGCFQLLGNLRLHYRYPDEPLDTSVTAFQRRLSLDSALATETFIRGDVQYRREYLTSFGNDVAVIRLSADRAKSINVALALDRPERGESRMAQGALILSGELASGTANPGMKYTAKVRVKLKDGQLTDDGHRLIVKQASEVLIYISMATDYKEKDFIAYVNGLLEKAYHTDFKEELHQHLNHYQALFHRVKVDLGQGENGQLPTDERLAKFYGNPQLDPGLPVLCYQFGRYLSISSTRVGLLPPNLQGLWANQIQTPWNGDYHLDVNVQMNHWPLEAANLSELNLPLADLVEGMVQPGERTAKAYYQAEGWVAHVITNIWGFTEPGESASWGTTKAGSGWLCNNLWDHYIFSDDTAYLRKIYPIIKGSAQFYASMLVEDPKTGYLVTSPSSSPENTFYLPNGKTASICAGPTIDNQIIRELFSNVMTASATLKTDDTFRSRLGVLLNRIPPAAQVAPDGRIMEWLENYKETDPQHRHISHLYGLFPANLITPEQTPELAEASKKTLEVRGDDGPSWTIAYKMLFWARLQDGNRAFKLLRELLKPTLKTDINYGAGGGVYPNMWSAGPPFQIDGNFGATAGIGEMLIQSHAGYIHLLPAIPDSWKSFGEVKGLKARHNITIDMTWRKGKIIAYRFLSPRGERIKAKINGKIVEIQTERG